LNGLLICDKCKGFYELQEGESSDDFSDQCECGGKLEYKEDLNKENPIKWRSIVIGIVITITIYLLAVFTKIDSVHVAIIASSALILGSFVAAYISGIKYKSDLLTAITVSSIAGVIMLIISFTTTNYNFQGSLIEELLIFIIIFILAPALLGILGSLLAILAQTPTKLDIKTLLIGTIITVIGLLVLIIPPIVGGYISGFMVDGSRIDGIKNGFLAAGIGTVLFITIGVIFDIYGIKEIFFADYTLKTILTIISVVFLVFIAGGIVGSIGGLISTFTQSIKK
jgi:hypothetical protein